MARAKVLAAVVGAVLLAGGAAAHVRLSSNGTLLFWQSPGSIGIVIQASGSDDLPDGSHLTALRNAIAAWNADPGTNANLVENTTPAQQARTDWSADDIHLILFDEANSSGFFPVGSATVAITPVWFSGSGRITDADVLFNGSGYQFSTSGEPGRFDVQAVGAHELGHLLGLDHSGWAGATMFPYVTAGGPSLGRSLALDDAHGMRDAYPAFPHGEITGTVRRSADSTVVRGAHVVARDSLGRTAGGALANSSGVFRLRGLEAGTYTVYAGPLDVPVSGSNLFGGRTIDTDFASTIGPAVAVAAGQTVAYGDLLVDPDAAIAMNAPSGPMPFPAVAGQSTITSVTGSDLAGVALEAGDPALSVSVLSSSASQVSFLLTVPAGAEPGHVDLVATSASGGVSILPAAFEVVPAAPSVSGVAPSSGSNLGGTFVTVSGSGFRPGARVVIGPRIYAEGEPGGAALLDSSTLTLTTAATPEGAFDVVVIDPTGVEGRSAGAFTFAAIPVLDTVFPPAGDAAGGTEVIVTGSSFASGLTVRIAGVTQSQVVVESATRLRVTTEPGVAGGPYAIEVENPGGAVGGGSFSYASQPDPLVASVAPAGGSTAGGNLVTITGSGFTASSEVVFGADPSTGAGGVESASVTLVDADTLRALVPAHAAGSVALLVRDGLTGQADVLAGGYTFASPQGSGGGGCYTLPGGDPWRGRDALFGSAWILLAWAGMWAVTAAQRRRPRAQRTS